MATVLPSDDNDRVQFEVSPCQQSCEDILF
jgi:hypothetical protein